MNVALRTRITKEEFLEWEERQELRYEFDGRRPIAMVGGTQAHELIITNVLFHLKLRLRGGPYQLFGNGMKIEAAGSIRYPDACVARGPLQPRSRLLSNPVVVFEVESESTALIDQTVKNGEYEATPSILRYVMLSQDGIVANVFARVEGQWVGSLVKDPAAVLHIPELSIEVPLGDFYEGVTFPTADA